MIFPWWDHIGFKDGLSIFLSVLSRDNMLNIWKCHKKDFQLLYLELFTKHLLLKIIFICYMFTINTVCQASQKQSNFRGQYSQSTIFLFKAVHVVYTVFLQQNVIGKNTLPLCQCIPIHASFSSMDSWC